MRFFLLLVFAGFATAASAETKSAVKTTANEGKKIEALPARVYFISPHDNETLTSPFEVKFGLDGMKLDKAGIQKLGTGHHHLVIDSAPIPKGQVVPKDDRNIHYGDASSSAKLKLAPGPHTLTLQFADGAHLSMGPEMSATIHVIVK
jgi:hypothetical protein